MHRLKSVLHYYLTYHEGLDLGRDHKPYLLCPKQMRSHGLGVFDVPIFMSQHPQSFHGIRIDDNLVLPYVSKVKTSVLKTKTPTQGDLDTLPVKFGNGFFITEILNSRRDAQTPNR
ncbi:MAG: hypothetical protein ACREOZ_01360 [Gloeomargaritales cyanobacterium]